MRKSTVIVTCSTAIFLAFYAPCLGAQSAPSLASPGKSSAQNDAPGPKQQRAEDHYFEVGVFGGALWLSDNHALETHNHQPFKTAGELGARVAYFPLAFLGAELEGAAGGSKTRSGDPADIWAIRGQAVVQWPGNIVVPFAVIGGGVLGAGSNATGSDSDKLFHFGAGAKLALDDFLGARLDLRDNLTQKYHASSGAQAHSPELTFGLTFTLDPVPEAPPKPAAPPDADGDGVPDAVDKCPKQAGPAPDGCPIAKDSDGDGVSDERDACPSEPGPAPTGCPDRDPDHDCVPVPQDKCPDVPGLAPDGCPDPDPDHDGITLDKDKCPNQPETVNGFEDQDGCPDTLPEQVEKYSGAVPGIEFELGRATIRPASHATLDEAAGVLKQYAGLRISITVHADSVGDPSKNLELSKARADAVRTYLVQQGIDSARIETLGASPAQPSTDKKLDAGRTKNARVEFKLLQ